MSIITCASRIARKIVSDRLKRLLLVSSLFGFLENKKRLDPVLLAALNAKFSLAYRPDAVELPIALNDMLLNPKDMGTIRNEINEKTITQDECRSLAKRVVDLLPEWMRYSDESCLLKDVCDTIDFVRFGHHQGI